MKVRELGHVVLWVRDLEKSVRFYRDILGFPEVGRMRHGRSVMFSTGRSHHELYLMEVGPDAEPVRHGPRAGMYHFGLKIGTTDEELKEAIRTCLESGVEIVGVSDHGVSHSLYIKDPDGNEVELYIDVQPERWREDPKAALVPTRALALD
jgi:catechol-2,3-dioxygenase